MEQIKNLGISHWANIARNYTEKAAAVKDWRLRNKTEHEFKKIAIEWTNGRGYIIATNYELAAKYPGMLDVRFSKESEKMIWGIAFNKYGRNKMSFIPVR